MIPALAFWSLVALAPQDSYSIPDPFLAADAWVQDELRLTQKQRDSLKGAEEEASDEKEFEGKIWALLASLSNDQNRRLRELSIRRAGLLALRNPGVQYEVGLTDALKVRIETLFDRYEAERRRLRDTVEIPSSPPLARAKALSLRNREEGLLLLEYRRKIRALLTADQSRRLREAMGATPTLRVEGQAAELLLDPRVQERLGWSMREARVFRENLDKAGDVNAEGPEGGLARFRRDRLVRETYAAQSSSRKRRLQELAVGRRGLMALADDAVAARLGLGPLQRDRVEFELARFADRMGEIRTMATELGGMAAVSAKVQDAEKTRDAALTRLLTPRQRTAWRSFAGVS